MSDFIKFETDADLQAETRIQATIERKWKCKLHKMPSHFGADFVAYKDDGTVVALVEVKEKSIPFAQFKDMMTPMRKRQLCLSVAAAGGIKAIQVIRYTDGDYWVDMFQPISQTKMVRDKRDREAGDFYPCVYWSGDVIRKL